VVDRSPPLGDVPIAYNDSGIGATDHLLSVLDSGLLVLAAFAINTSRWDTAPSGTVSLYISVTLPDTAATVTVADYTACNTPQVGAEPRVVAYGAAGARQKGSVITQTGSQLLFGGYPDAGVLASGASDVYVLAIPT
jgi:hypothetical protein